MHMEKNQIHVHTCTCTCNVRSYTCTHHTSYFLTIVPNYYNIWLFHGIAVTSLCVYHENMQEIPQTGYHYANASSPNLGSTVIALSIRGQLYHRYPEAGLI